MFEFSKEISMQIFVLHLGEKLWSTKNVEVDSEFSVVYLLEINTSFNTMTSY